MTAVAARLGRLDPAGKVVVPYQARRSAHWSWMRRWRYQEK
jgi:hypothetical protein